MILLNYKLGQGIIKMIQKSKATFIFMVLILFINEIAFSQAYKVKSGDTLWHIAVKYYDNWYAFKGLYEINKRKINQTWYSSTNKELRKKFPNPWDYILVGTELTLPHTICIEGNTINLTTSNCAGILLNKKHVPLTDIETKQRLKEITEEMEEKPNKIKYIEQILDNINVEIEQGNRSTLKSVIYNLNDKKGTPIMNSRKARNHKPSTSFEEISTNIKKIDRSISDQKDISHLATQVIIHKNHTIKSCSVAICNKFQSLCFVDCYVIARRFKDSLVDKKAFDMICSDLPDILPFDIRSSDENCILGEGYNLETE